ncbi:PhzF family phenazine biosynthesis protein [Leisingera sp. M527]|uniref:PhzF family phenazine biosynthesis protein n=1 Tax=Leisingera sp. M527 TaxID=2867014 RepID=UPI0021A4EDDD|nr:PhzF family phenazine biosynthesis protein [Leisingera sp. M527]UWQ32377.1 PhzF family phenazine biosynthesis protein [Leisingera sp. M527]
MHYVLCDAFSDGPFTGNSLAVFPDARALNSRQMLQLTRELKHFESAFLTGPALPDGSRPLRVFDLEEELPFAGHPLLGAAAVLHQLEHPAETAEAVFALGERRVSLRSGRREAGFDVQMDQGLPLYLADLNGPAARELASCFSLAPEDLAPGLPMEVISTGLRYLVVPVHQGLDRAAIRVPDLEHRLADVGAQFAYLFDVHRNEGRHWTNDGRIEDIATGSAAGVIGAYAHKHGLLNAASGLELKQGQHAGRPSRISVRVDSGPDGIRAIQVGGQVSILGTGRFEVLP